MGIYLQFPQTEWYMYISLHVCRVWENTTGHSFEGASHFYETVKNGISFMFSSVVFFCSETESTKMYRKKQ